MAERPDDDGGFRGHGDNSDNNSRTDLFKKTAGGQHTSTMIRLYIWFENDFNNGLYTIKTVIFSLFLI